MTWIPVKTSPRVAARVLAALLLAATACGARQGALPECIQESDCPSSGDECNPTRCFNHTCRPGSVPGGGLVGVQPPCQRRYCNTNGQVVVGPDPAACLPEAPDLVSSPVEGTAPVMLQGRYLAGATVSVDGVTVPSTSSADGTSLTFTPPPQPLGRTLLALQNANGRSTHAFFRVARLPAGRTLVADGALDDWPADYLAMAADLPPDPTPADALRRLLVAYDDAGLWLGVDGATATSPANGLLLYLEPFVAFVGITPGPRDLRTLTDASNPLSDACASSIQLDAPDWYFPYCAGTTGMASVGIGEGLPATGLAGLRDLTSPAAFDWRLDASGHSRVAVAASVTSGAVEFHIPWGALGFTSRPPDWSAVVLAAVIVGPDGQAVSTQSLPVNTPGHVTDLYRLEITW